ncbi:MAG: hypothetical protein HS117_22290 [Verrucomicrobiaceae bacterium]|nr:hypothetical protein [Verrucomicrobiaceae bacterium]
MNSPWNFRWIPVRPIVFTSFLLAVWTSPLRATVDESHDYCMEAATPFVEQGFIVREDYWNGEVKSGQKLMISHQLFKGNEYAFWLGSASSGVQMDIKVFDEKGQPLSMDKKTQEHFMSVRVNPPKTGTYKIVFELKSKDSTESVLWALSYGYR